MCACLGKGSRNVQKTPGGLLFHQRWNNLQFVISAAFLMTIYADYLTTAGKNVQCPRSTPLRMSFMPWTSLRWTILLKKILEPPVTWLVTLNNFPEETHHSFFNCFLQG
ncbi:hypothetical protein MKW92_037851 [Papaver armeniacum]|nr:hypothetical protein MKW92_037851 [Papaver armeniacum]